MFLVLFWSVLIEAELEELSKLRSIAHFTDKISRFPHRGVIWKGSILESGENAIDCDWFVDRTHREEKLIHRREGIPLFCESSPSIGVLATDRPDRKVEKFVDLDAFESAQRKSHGVRFVELGEDTDRPETDL